MQYAAVSATVTNSATRTTRAPREAAALVPSSAAARTYSLDTNPTSGGTPASDSSPTRAVRRPAGAPEPAAQGQRRGAADEHAAASPMARKSSALNIACEQQVQDARRRARPATGATRDGREHDGDLAEGGVGEQPLEVALAEGEHGGPDHGHARDQRRAPAVRVSETAKQREQPREHVGPGGDHGRRVDERGRGRRALHGVGEPVVERELRRLAGDADEQQTSAAVQQRACR